MNDDTTPEDELERRLRGARDELRSRPPRPDTRLEAVLSPHHDATVAFARPPEIDVSPGIAVSTVTPLTRSRRRERLGVIAAVAATLVLVVGAGAVAFDRSDGPDLDTVLDPATADPTPGPAPQDPPGEAEPAEPDADEQADNEADNEAEHDGAREFFGGEFFNKDFEGHRAWLLCVTDAFSLSLEDRFETPFTTEGCGAFPPIPDFDFEGDLEPRLERWFGCIDPRADTGDGTTCVDHGLEVFPFHDLGPGAFDEACRQTDSDNGFHLECRWPPCPDGADSCPELDLDLDLDFGFGLDLGELPGLPPDFVFPWDRDDWPWGPDHMDTEETDDPSA